MSFKSHLLCLESYFYITGEFGKVDIQFAVQIVPWTTDEINKDIGIRIRSQGLGHTTFQCALWVTQRPWQNLSSSYLLTPHRGQYIVTVFQFGLLGTYCHSRHTKKVPLPGWGGGNLYIQFEKFTDAQEDAAPVRRE